VSHQLEFKYQIDFEIVKWVYAGIFVFEFVDILREEFWFSLFKYSNGVDVFIFVRQLWPAQSLMAKSIDS
jgi:hypothetical protein